MAKYKLTKDGAQNTETTAFIPDDPGNNDWREYQKWLKDGGVPDPQFTAEELEARKQLEKTQAENAVIEARGKLDMATAEGIDVKRFEDELTKAGAALVKVGELTEIR